MDTYKEKYENALGWMKKIYPTLTGADKEDAEHYFPELAENENERIRKDMISYIGGLNHKEKAKWIAYLEKQKRQKLAEWSEEDENKIESIKGLIITGRFADTNTIRTIWKLLDSLRPSWKPSEEQMGVLEYYMNTLICTKNTEILFGLYNDLKKLM